MSYLNLPLTTSTTTLSLSGKQDEHAKSCVSQRRDEQKKNGHGVDDARAYSVSSSV